MLFPSCAPLHCNTQHHQVSPLRIVRGACLGRGVWGGSVLTQVHKHTCKKFRGTFFSRQRVSYIHTQTGGEASFDTPRGTRGKTVLTGSVGLMTLMAAATRCVCVPVCLFVLHQAVCVCLCAYVCRNKLCLVVCAATSCVCVCVCVLEYLCLQQRAVCMPLFLCVCARTWRCRGAWNLHDHILAPQCHVQDLVKTSMVAEPTFSSLCASFLLSCECVCLFVCACVRACAAPMTCPPRACVC